MRKAIQILRTLAVLLCAVSVVLAFATRATMTGGVADRTVLTALFPLTLTQLQSTVLDVLVAVAIGVMFLRATVCRELESPSRLCISLLAIQTVLAFLVADDLQFGRGHRKQASCSVPALARLGFSARRRRYGSFPH